MFYKRIGTFYLRSAACIQITISLCFTSGIAAFLPCKGERWHCNFAMFYKRNWSPPLGAIFSDRRISLGFISEMKGCQGPTSFRHVQKCINFAMFYKRNAVPAWCVLSPDRRKSLGFISGMEGCGEVTSLRSVRRRLHFAMLYKRNGRLPTRSVHPRDLPNSLCVTSEFEGLTAQGPAS